MLLFYILRTLHNKFEGQNPIQDKVGMSLPFLSLQTISKHA